MGSSGLCLILVGILTSTYYKLNKTIEVNRMSNNKSKKKEAEEFNKMRQERLAIEQDRVNNPEKYSPKNSKAALRRAMLWAAIAATTQ